MSSQARSASCTAFSELRNSVSLFVERKIITGPVIKLTEFAKKISSGKFGDRVNITTSDEIAELGGVMNYMSQNLDTAFKELSIIENIASINIVEKNLTETLESLIDVSGKHKYCGEARKTTDYGGQCLCEI